MELHNVIVHVLHLVDALPHGEEVLLEGPGHPVVDHGQEVGPAVAAPVLPVADRLLASSKVTHSELL